MSDDIAVVHKHYPERGGAEAVADELARTFDTEVLTAFDCGHSAADVETRELMADSWLFRKTAMSDLPASYLLRDALYAVKWPHQPALARYNTLIMSGCNPWLYVPRDDQTIIRYTHSTPRQPYDRHQEAGGPILTRLYSLGVRTIWGQSTPWSECYVANSELVARRLRKYLGVDDAKIDVVYPPINVSQFNARPSSGDYYLALNRLVHHKGLAETIDAVREHGDAELVIAGAGPERDALKERAAGCDRIDFVGHVAEPHKRDLLADAKALIYAAENEDFGMVPVEAMAAGTPVIGVRDGFTQHQIQNGENGILFDRGVSQLVAAIEEFERSGVAWGHRTIARFADQFGVDRFRQEMRAIVKREQSARRVDPDLEVPDNGDSGATKISHPTAIANGGGEDG